jgi:tRNA threonylcarbamoyladenosine biosynthesis protein TsaB
MNGAWLILETSSRTAKLGLARSGAIVRAAILDDSRRHARDLAATAAGFLKAESLSPRDLTGIVVGRGPGSYTGLRVGLTSAKALAYAVGCKIIAVDTFAAIAEQAPPEAAELWVIADALQGHVYVQRFEGKRAVDQLRIVTVEEWLPWAAPGTWVSGPGVKVFADRIPTDCRQVKEPDREPRVESVLAAAARIPPLTRQELFALEPLYLRGSSAEEKAKAAK